MSLTITQADQGKSFEVNQGDVITIRLAENPGTGYRWAIDQMHDEILEFQNSGFSPASEAGIGGSGQRIFTFNAKTLGAVQIWLKSWRDWQGDKSIAEWFNITIQVQERRQSDERQT